MAPRTQNLFDQLDDLFVEESNDTDTTEDSNFSYNDSYEASATPATSIYNPSLPPSPLKQRHARRAPVFNHEAFRRQLRMASDSHNNLTNIVDCFEDMVLQETQQLEKELLQFVTDMQNSVPMNTYALRVFPRPLRLSARTTK